MFEIVLNEHYEDNYKFRDVERATKQAEARNKFIQRSSIKTRSSATNGEAEESKLKR